MLYNKLIYTGVSRAKKSLIVLGEKEYHKIYQEPYNWGNIEQLHALNRNVCFFIGLSMNDPNLRRLIDGSNEDGEGGNPDANGNPDGNGQKSTDKNGNPIDKTGKRKRRLTQQIRKSVQSCASQCGFTVLALNVIVDFLTENLHCFWGVHTDSYLVA